MSALTKPRLVYVCPFSPVPPSWGGAIRFDAIWRALRCVADVDLVILGDKPPLEIRRELYQRGAAIFPPKQETLPRRAARVVRAFASGECIPAARFLSPRRLARVVEYIESRRPDVIVLGFEYLSPLLPALRRLRVPLVVDAHNAASRAYSRVVAATRNPAVKVGYWMLERNARVWERSFLPLADRLWTVSASDAAFYQPLIREPAAVVPNAIPFPEDPVRHEEPGTVLFTGSFAYWPNEDAALRLISMTDGLHREGTVRKVLLVGRDPTARMRAEAAKRRHVVVTGEVPDVMPYFRQASVLAAPLAAGSGTKLKIIESFSQQVAVVTTEIGAEGLDLVTGAHAEIVSLSAFPAALRELMRNAERRETLAKGGRTWGRERFSYEVMERIVRLEIAGLLGSSAVRDGPVAPLVPTR